MLTTSSILFPTDFSENARRAFEVALSVARKTGAALCVVHVLSDPEIEDPSLSNQVRSQQKARAEKSLRDLMSGSAVDDVALESRLLTDGDPDDVILTEATTRSADLIVLGAYGRRGERQYDLGRTARSVLRNAGSPVLTVQADDGPLGTREDRSLFRRVLVPTDFSDASRRALEYASDLCKLFGATALMLHVVEEFVPPGIYGLNSNPIREMSQKIEDRARAEMNRITANFEKKGVDVENHIASGHAPSEIVAFAETHDIDLIVISSRGTRLERFVLGSVADRVVRAAACSVLTVKPTPR